MNGFRVDKTLSRGPRGDYCVCLSPAERKSLGLNRFAVVVHSPPGLGLKLCAPCRVAVDESLASGSALLDHSLRFAVGIPFDGHGEMRIQVYPLKLTVRQALRYFLSWLLGGRRYIVFRVCKPLMNDIECGICRIPEGTFALLGCEEGDNLVVESAVECEDGSFRLGQIKLQGFAVSEEQIRGRAALEQPSMEARFRDAGGLLGVAPDLERLFLDRLDRKDLGVEPVCPVRAVRGLGNQFAKHMREFGIIALATLFAVIPLMTFGITEALPWIAVALLVTALLVVWRLRSML